MTDDQKEFVDLVEQSMLGSIHAEATTAEVTLVIELIKDLEDFQALPFSIRSKLNRIMDKALECARDLEPVPLLRQATVEEEQALEEMFAEHFGSI